LFNEVKLKFPPESAVVLPEAAPLRVTVAPEPTEAGVMDPLIMYVAGVTAPMKLTPMTSAPLIVTAWLVGVKP
jgi:hypothetical protein